MNQYVALALQKKCHGVSRLEKEEARTSMMDSIQNIGKQIFASKLFIGQDVKLVVLPEYFLTGYPMGDPVSIWQEKACIKEGDEFFQALAEIAKKEKVFLSGNAYELDENFPDIYFQCSFIFSDKGELILKYRRLNSMYTTTPHDVWDRYLEIYDEESLFPVVDTSIGRLACIASEEILYPEVARCLAMRGAEVFCHSTSEVANFKMTPKDIAKRARAYENMTYVVSANSAGISGTLLPEHSTDGNSQIIDYHGHLLINTGTGESMSAFHTIDIHSLRAYRDRAEMPNMLARQRFELYANSYKNHSHYAPNTLLDQKLERGHFRGQIRKSVDRLKSKNII